MNDQKALARQHLAPEGTLRVAINYGNPVLAQRGEDGEPGGVSVMLARHLAAELDVALEIVTFDAAGEVFRALDDIDWRLAFLARDPVRAERIHFSEPYVLIEGTYLVHQEAGFQQVGDLDSKGVRIAVGKGAAYDLFLTRELQQATLVRAPTSTAAVDLFVDQGFEAAAGVRQPLEHYAGTHAGYRVLPGRFTAIEQCMAIPKHCYEADEYVASFLKRMKFEGHIKKALEESGQKDVQAAD